MSEEKKRPPERLLKKKCQCGEQLKMFALTNMTFLPEWIASEIYKRSVEKDKIAILPGTIGIGTVSAIVFNAECQSCGNISTWNMNKEEFEYLNSVMKEDGYGLSWLYRPSFIKKQIEGYPPDIAKSIMTLVEAVHSSSGWDDVEGEGNGNA